MSTSQSTPRVDRVAVAGRPRAGASSAQAVCDGGRRAPAAPLRRRRRSAGPRPSRRRDSGARSSQRTARRTGSESAGDAGGHQRRDDRAGAVDVVRAPAAEPRTVGLLRVEQPLARRAWPRRVSARPQSPEHLDDVRGDVGGGRVDHRAEVAERQLLDQPAGVVGVERAPAAVARLHADRPSDAALDRRADVGPRRRASAAQRQHHLGGVVDVGVGVVGELERPAGRRRGRGRCTAQSPVTRTSSASSHSTAALHRRVVGSARRRRAARSARAQVSHTGDWQASSRRITPSGVSRGSMKPSRPVERRDQRRMVERVAEQVQREDRVDPRRLDAAPPAVGLLAMPGSIRRRGCSASAAARLDRASGRRRFSALSSSVNAVATGPVLAGAGGARRRAVRSSVNGSGRDGRRVRDHGDRRRRSAGPSSPSRRR